MARYKKIDPRLWGDGRIRELGPQPPHPLTLFIYLLTGPHNSTLPGAFVGSIAGFADLLKWSVPSTKAAFQALTTPRDKRKIGNGRSTTSTTAQNTPRDKRKIGKGESWALPLVRHDQETGLFIVPNAFKYNLPESMKVLKSWVNQLDELPECQILIDYVLSIKDFLLEHRPEWGKAFTKLVSEPTHSLSKETPESTAYQEHEHEHEQEQEPEHDGEQEPVRGKPTPLPPPSHTPPAARVSSGPYIEKPKAPGPADPALAALSDADLEKTLSETCTQLGLKPDRILALQKNRRDLEITLRAFRMQLARKNRGTPEPSSELTPDPPPKPALPSPQEIRDNVTDLRNRLRNGQSS